MSKLYLGIDIGGTSIVAARFSDNEMLDKKEVPTGADRPAGQIMESLYEAIGMVLTDEVVGIGIGMPGFMNAETGEIMQINNIPSFNGYAIKPRVEEKFNLPTFQNNDANCFALGETYYGAGKKYTNLVGVTLGTGLGGGIILNRKIHTGLMGGAGELGCVPFHGGILYKKAKAGDQAALAVFDELAHNIGELFRIVMYVLAPEAFIVGGSVANSWDLLEKPLREEVNNFLVPMISKNVDLVKAELDNAGLYGAAALCISQME